MLRRGKRAHGHRLLEIFSGDLLDEERSEITRRYTELRKCSADRMMRDLADFSEAFINWRYCYEDKKIRSGLIIDVGTLNAFAKSAYFLIRDLEPSWEIEPYFHDRVVSSGKLEFLVTVVGYDQTATNRAINQWILRTFWGSKPHLDFIKGEQKNLAITTPLLNFYGQTAALKLKFGGGTDPQDSGACELGE